MSLAILLGVQALTGIATLVLISIGLSVIFGMMRVVNIAHGEFIMLGGYATVLATQAGVNVWMAIFVVAPVTVGLIGVVVERCFIRFFYGRLVDTLLATWGLSLVIIGTTTAAFGNRNAAVAVDTGFTTIGGFRFSAYSLILIAVAVLVLAAIAGVLRFTRAGLVARATMQNATMAATLGYNPARIYMVTFGIGSALAGLAGGLLAPLSGVTPLMGTVFIGQAFITVVTGGAAVVSGTTLAAMLLGSVNDGTTVWLDPVAGDVALLAVAIVLLRLMPQGLTGRFFRNSL